MERHQKIWIGTLLGVKKYFVMDVDKIQQVLLQNKMSMHISYIKRYIAPQKVLNFSHVLFWPFFSIDEMHEDKQPGF